MTTTIERDGDVAVIRFDEGKGNSLSYDTMNALTRVLDEVESSSSRAVVLTGAGRVFSAGLDLKACSRYDRASMVRYVDAFESCFERIFTFAKPLVGALNGHAIAGGAVIALACDARVMSPSSTLCLNEVAIGIPLPSFAFEIGRCSIPPQHHVDGILASRSYSAADALAAGIARAVDEDCVAAALKIAREWSALGSDAACTVKSMLRADFVRRARATAKKSRAQFVDVFFGAEAQSRIKAVVAKLERAR